MGYTTDFLGRCSLSRELTTVEKNYINDFSETRRMKRDVNKLMEKYNGKHGHPTPASDKPDDIYGLEGSYFVMNDGDYGQTHDETIIDYNTAPGYVGYLTMRLGEQPHEDAQPGLWCQWVIDEENNLVWDGNEKFYEYVKWLKYLIKHFFSRWGVVLNGSFEWKGEDTDDIGKIVVENNVVKTLKGTIAYIEVEE